MLALWRNWIVANVIGEIVGFGLAGAVMMGVVGLMGLEQGQIQLAPLVVSVIAMGALEGTAVGLAQHAVLGSVFASLTRASWLVATIAGAILAWGCGMVVGQLAGDAFASSDIDTPIVGALVIGALAGVVLAGPQWLVLRRAGVDARWWIPAHAFGWSVGMVVAFAGVGALPSSAALVFTMIAMAGTGLGMGALVAAVTGLALVDAARIVPAPAAPRS